MELYDEVAGALQLTNRRNGSRSRPEDVRAAVVALRASQFVFEGRSPAHFALLKSMASALQPHFELSGSRLVIDDGEGYAALVPVEEASRLPLTTEETLILLTLRWIYESKVELREIETDGTAMIDEAGVQQWYEKNTGRAWPKRPVARAAFELFERRGIIISSLDDLENRVVFIRGVVRLVTGSAWTGRLRAFAEALQARIDGGDVTEADDTGVTSGETTGTVDMEDAVDTTRDTDTGDTE